ncbi:MAG: hypothetical protein ACTSRE_02255 [Promethearchaeota archaeon]
MQLKAVRYILISELRCYIRRKKKISKLYRHGDVLIQEVETIPKKAKKIKGNILVRGEVTGHAHRLDGTYQILETPEFLYVDIAENDAKILHEEHDPITLPKGKYKVWVQREYTPEAIRRVID